MINVDGRTDAEKLLELLTNGTEDRELDYKQYLDLSRGDAKHTVELAKDCAAMANLPRGGYIVVGAEDDGTLASTAPEIVQKQFDSADLRGKVRPFIDGPIHLVSAVHIIEGRPVALIYVRPDSAGLPVLMKKNGVFKHPSGGTETVFFKGQMFTRGGSSNEMAYEHWDDALSEYRARIFREASRDTDALLQQVLDAIRGIKLDGSATIPLTTEMGQAALAEALVTNFAAGDAGMAPIRQFITKARDSARPTADGSEQALDQLCLVALVALQEERIDVFERVVGTYVSLYRAAAEYTGEDYDLASSIKNQYYLNVLVRVLVIGSRVVREQRWEVVPLLVLHPVNAEPTYQYVTWLRHGQVQASRNNLLRADVDDSTGGNLLSLCRSHMIEHPELRSDRPDASVEVARGDALLDSLCQLDLLWCLISAIQPHERLGFPYYPNFAVFYGERAEPALERVARDPAVRVQLFGDAKDRDIAEGMSEVIQMSSKESRNLGFHTELRPSVAVTTFLAHALVD